MKGEGQWETMSLPYQSSFMQSFQILLTGCQWGLQDSEILNILSHLCTNHLKFG